MGSERYRDIYERVWREPVPPDVADGSAWYKLLLDTALKNPNIPTYVRVIEYPEGNNYIVSTYIETSRGDVVEVLSPPYSFPSKMLIETILLLY